ncbi:MAG: RNA-binding cell elongation regulator Jag/EloR [Eubacteriales bacterium]|nr:RNA-binding cell elongation regulator Jag/EloR [Eubacteriales bacterium]
MDVMEFKGKTKEDAIMEAAVQLGVSSDQLKYEVVDEGSSGFLGIFNVKPVVIRVTLKKTLVERTQEFCDELFSAMKVETMVSIDYKEEDNIMNIDLSGPDMGILIGKRGQTLDALQYLISLFVNKEGEGYVRVKLDTENYRERRRVTLEKLAKKIAYTVKRTKKSISLEPMNPYERRVIHSALQNDRYVCTRSEGEEPYRKVVIMLKKER